jgi:hypothetical protein
VRWRTVIRLLAVAGVFTLATMAPATAGPFTRSPLKVVSILGGAMAEPTARGPPHRRRLVGTALGKPLEPRRPRCDDRER